LSSLFRRGTETPRPEVIDEAVATGGVAPDPAADERHVDWLRSGAGFDDRSFDVLMDALVSGMLRAC
jgi:hypothetical protein